jgi:ankyrin repeat protein
MAIAIRPVGGLRAATLLGAVLCIGAVHAGRADDAPATLIDAVKAKDQGAALAMIAHKADVRAREPDGTTALHWAAHEGEVEVVRALVRAGADVSARNDYGSTPIQEAAVAANTPILETLLKAGANVESPNPEGQTVLMVVARTGNVEAAKLLLHHGAKVNATEQWGGQSALMWAAAQRQPEMVKLLLAHGAQVNARSTVRDWQRRVTAEGRPKIMNHGGFTPLLYAAREGCIPCAQYLVKAGADLNLADPDETTPLLLALLNMHYEFASYLISAGADVNKWDFFGQTPLYVAIDMNTLPTGGRPDLPSVDNLTGLQVAEMLLKKGANPNAQLKLRPQYRNGVFDRGGDQVLATGATPLLLAAKVGDVAAVQLLLKYHAIVDLPNSLGVTPLMAAAGMGHSFNPTRGRYKTDAQGAECVRILQAAGGDINARTPTGLTALHSAAQHGWDETVKVLVDDGAKLEAADNKGLRPIDYSAGRYERAFLEPQPPRRESTIKLLTQYIVASTGRQPLEFAGDLSRQQKGVGQALTN